MADVRIDRISKVYPNGFQAVNGLSLELPDGEFLVLVGPSGCGKSTALRMIAGLEPISSGDLYVGDRRVNDVQPKDRDIAMVFQNYALYPQMTVAENIGFPLKLRRLAKGERKERVNSAADILELRRQLDKKPAQLSGGQRQRVAMGRAIVRKPALFLMDEPLSNLDAKLRVQMRADIAEIQRDLGVTTFYVTHDQVEAMTMGDRVAVIKDGQLQQVAAPEDLYHNPVNVFVAAFIGSPSMNLFEAKLVQRADQFWLQLGGQELEVTGSVKRIAALGQYAGKAVVVGIRPESLEDAAVVTGYPDGSRLDAVVEVREALGSETLIHFDLALTVDTGDPDVDAEKGEHADHRCTARFNSASRASVGDRIKVNVEVKELHWFDPKTRLAIRD